MPDSLPQTSILIGGAEFAVHLFDDPESGIPTLRFYNPAFHEVRVPLTDEEPDEPHKVVPDVQYQGKDTGSMLAHALTSINPPEIIERVTPEGASRTITVSYCGQARPVLKEGKGTWQLAVAEQSTETQVLQGFVDQGFAKWKGRRSARRFVPNRDYECRVVTVAREISVKIKEEFKP